jgi:hypothetical protein
MQIHEDTMRILQESESIIRQLTRDKKYWLAADELTKMWFENLFMPDPLVRRAVINLTCAIDLLYENCGDEEGLDRDRVRALGDELSEPIQYTGKDAGSCRDLLSAIRAIISAISREGKVLLGRSNLTSDAAETWWVLWRKVLHEHNWQQACSVQMLVDAHFPAKHAATSFSEGVGAYLDDCAETIGVSPVVVGVLPFSTTLKGDDVLQMIHVLRDSTRTCGANGIDGPVR